MLLFSRIQRLEKSRVMEKRDMRFTGGPRGCNDRGVPDRWTEICSVERWSRVQIHRGRLVCCRLQVAGRGGHVLGNTRRGRGVKHMQLAQGQLWRIWADYAYGYARHAGGSGSD